jgi:hypothetical protein
MGLPTSECVSIACALQEFDEFTADLPIHQRYWLRFQFRCQRLAEKQMFDNVFLFFIVLGTIMLAMEYDGQPWLHCGIFLPGYCLHARISSGQPSLDTMWPHAHNRRHVYPNDGNAVEHQHCAYSNVHL